MNWDTVKARLLNAVRGGGGSCKVTVTLMSGVTVTGVAGLDAPIGNWSPGEIHLVTEKRSGSLFHIIAVSEIAMYSVVVHP